MVVVIWSWQINWHQNSADYKVIKGTIMQIEKASINDRLRVSKVPWKHRIPTIYNFAVTFTREICYFLKM